MNKISAVYKVVNTMTGDSYVGSSKDVKLRWVHHKCPSTWKYQPNSLLYQDMQKYGVDKFRFQILAPVMSEYLTQVEQEFIDMLHPTYNNSNAKGLNVERRKETCKKYQKEYHRSDKYKGYMKEYLKKYSQTDKGKEVNRRGGKKYSSQLCSFNGETLTLGALATRFRRASIEQPYVEARKYLLTR